MYNTNGDDMINEFDSISADKLTIIESICDLDNDGTVYECEIFDCLVITEN
jgi:hypothetical protein